MSDHQDNDECPQIDDDELAPLADEEKVPLSSGDGSREDIVAPERQVSGGGDGCEADAEDTLAVLVQSDGSKVTTTTAGAKTTVASEQDDGCCARCCRCLANVPYGTLVSWVFLTAMVSTCGGSLMVAIARSRDILDQDDLLPYSDAMCLGILFGMVFVATIALIAASLSSPPTSSSVFSSSAKNMCGRVFNVIVIVLLVLLAVAWVAVSVVVAIPMMLLVVIHIRVKVQGATSLDLMNYGLFSESKEYSGDKLELFYERLFETEDVMICYAIALLASILVVLALILLIICATSNYIHLRDSRFTDYNAFGGDSTHVKNSVLDTRM